MQIAGNTVIEKLTESHIVETRDKQHGAVYSNYQFHLKSKQCNFFKLCIEVNYELHDAKLRYWYTKPKCGRKLCFIKEDSPFFIY